MQQRPMTGNYMSGPGQVMPGRSMSMNYGAGKQKSITKIFNKLLDFTS